MPASQIADYIGYANPSAFSRAFRRWTRMGPVQWRASRRVSPPKRPRSRGGN